MNQYIKNDGLITLSDPEFVNELIISGPQVISDTGKIFLVITMQSMREFIDTNNELMFHTAAAFKKFFLN